MKLRHGLSVVFAMPFASNAATAAEVLLCETIENVTSGHSGGDPKRFGIPTIADFNADNDRSPARFEYPDGGRIRQDAGVQGCGASSNPTPARSICARRDTVARATARGTGTMAGSSSCAPDAAFLLPC